MSKVNYPDQGGLGSIVRSPVNDTVRNLANAKGYCSFAIPSDFSCRRYVQNLPNVIEEYISRANVIYKNAVDVDNTFKFAFENVAAASAGLDLNVIDERDRLVK